LKFAALRFDRWTAASVGRHAWLALLALQPFNQFGALRQIAGLLLLVSLSITGWRAWRERRFAMPRPGIVVATGLALAAWALAVSLLGPYPADSLQALRKALLVQALMVAGGLCYIRTTADLRRALAWALAGFAVLTLLSAGEVLNYWRDQGISLAIPRAHGDWWGGYGATGACMVSLLAGAWLLPGQTRVLRLGGLALAALAAVLVFLYWARTPLVVMVLGVCVVALFGKSWRLLGGIVVAGVLAALLLSSLPDERLDRYRSLLQGQTYVSNTGLSLRPALWQGMVEVIAERPLTGYGYGWKKLAWAINDGGFAARWQQEGGGKATYFLAGRDEASYGRVNPHNYFLQAAFEIGVPGLLLALAFWALLLKQAARLLARTAPPEHRALAVAVFGLVGAYWLSNFTNGQWEGGLANLTLALAAGVLALSRDVRTDA
jgi:O-antigen ligase